MLDSFNIKINFAPDGTVDEVSYWDQEGCGHERVMSLGDDLDDVIQYHLGHMAQSHDLRPVRRCDFQLATIDRGRLHCTLESHGPETKHQFEVT